MKRAATTVVEHTDEDENAPAATRRRRCTSDGCGSDTTADAESNGVVELTEEPAVFRARRLEEENARLREQVRLLTGRVSARDTAADSTAYVVATTASMCTRAAEERAEQAAAELRSIRAALAEEEKRAAAPLDEFQERHPDSHPIGMRIVDPAMVEDSTTTIEAFNADRANRIRSVFQLQRYMELLDHEQHVDTEIAELRRLLAAAAANPATPELAVAFAAAKFAGLSLVRELDYIENPTGALRVDGDVVDDEDAN